MFLREIWFQNKPPRPLFHGERETGSVFSEQPAQFFLVYYFPGHAILTGNRNIWHHILPLRSGNSLYSCIHVFIALERKGIVFKFLRMLCPTSYLSGKPSRVLFFFTGQKQSQVATHTLSSIKVHVIKKKSKLHYCQNMKRKSAGQQVHHMNRRQKWGFQNNCKLLFVFFILKHSLWLKFLQ